MKSWTASLLKIASLAALAGGTFCPSGVVYAQEQQDENAKPKPAAHAPMIDPNDEQNTTDPNALQPDTTPLTGAQSPGLGSTEFRHSYWVPGFTVANTAQSNPFGGNGGNSAGWFDTTYLAGNLSLLENWSHSHLALNYSGGGYFSTDNSQGSGSYQQLGVVQSFNWQRWQLAFFDEFAYLPTTQFGFGGLSNIGAPGIGGVLTPGAPGLGNPYVPDQSVLFSNGPRYSNSFTTQATYELSRRGSITLVGSYGILRFTDSGNIGNDDAIGSIGYNYVLSKKDTLGVLYRFSGYHFMGFPQALGNHVFNLAYSRRITGRLAFSLFGGPEITTFRIPIGTSTSRIDGAFGTTFSYALKSGGLTFGYSHGTSGGSGVLQGSTEDQVNAGATRHLSRLWTARGNFGFSRIHAFTPSNAPSTPGFNSYYFGAGLDRPLGRNANLSFGYTAYVQQLNDAACLGCGTSTQHQISVGFSWHTRPFVLR
ncbi:MAG: hypothetical protein ABLT11_01920 [Candidatus Acidiferrum sp.]